MITGISFGCDTPGCGSLVRIDAYDAGYAFDLAAEQYGWSERDGQRYCSPCSQAKAAVATIRIAFAWTGPKEALLPLTDAGHLEHLDGDEYAWTATLAGDVGPGTPEEQEGRAQWIAQDLLTVLLGDAVDEEEDLARWFTHRSTAAVDEAGHPQIENTIEHVGDTGHTDSKNRSSDDL